MPGKVSLPRPDTVTAELSVANVSVKNALTILELEAIVFLNVFLLNATVPSLFVDTPKRDIL